MMKINNLVRRKIGRLRILSRGPNTPSGRATWNCRCSCRNKVRVIGYNLTSVPPHTTSCGCARENIAKARRLRPFESLYRKLLHVAAKQGWEVALSYEDFVRLTKTTDCHYCGSPVQWSAFNYKRNGSAYNLDRKNCKKGYTKKNAVVCCARCNRAKSNSFSYREWMAMTAVLRK